MKLPLRIHFENQDYSYTILNNTLDRTTTEIRITISNREYTIIRNEKNEWRCTDLTIADDAALFSAIGRNIGLRYQL